ncbi:unnamed protein product, partial [Mesorhabditis belari]|uniref:K Homology domain-containing protein n=1 Tax=Mesorhabditis belari TaxID=2138241 RepID=A0AAF3EJT8_9BILA
MDRKESGQNLEIFAKHIKLPLLEPSRIGAFIGPKGFNLRSIEEKYDVHLHFKPEQSLEIIGPTDKAVELGEIAVEKLVLGLFATGCSHTIAIPSKMIGFLIGSKGKTITDIRTRSGVKIEILGKREKKAEESNTAIRQENSTPANFVDENGLEFTRVIIYGDYANIRIALTMISGHLGDFGKEFVHNNTKKMEFFEHWNEVKECN